jgi:hypothetical protein
LLTSILKLPRPDSKDFFENLTTNENTQFVSTAIQEFEIPTEMMFTILKVLELKRNKERVFKSILNKLVEWKKRIGLAQKNTKKSYYKKL